MPEESPGRHGSSSGCCFTPTESPRPWAASSVNASICCVRGGNSRSAVLIPHTGQVRVWPEAAKPCMPGCGTGSSKGDKQDGDLRQSHQGSLTISLPAEMTLWLKLPESTGAVRWCCPKRSSISPSWFVESACDVIEYDGKTSQVRDQHPEHWPLRRSAHPLVNVTPQLAIGSSPSA